MNSNKQIGITYWVTILSSIIVLSVILSVYDFLNWNIIDATIDGVMVELHGLLFEIIFFGLILGYIGNKFQEQINQKLRAERIERYKSELSNFQLNPQNQNQKKVELIKNWISEGARLNLSSTQLPGVNLIALNLSEGILNNINLNDSDITNVKFIDAELEFAELKNAKLSFCKFISAKLNNSRLDQISMDNCDFSCSKLNEAIMTGAKIQGSNFTGADLTNIDLQNSQLEHVNLTGADLTGANLKGAKLTNCTLDNVIWKNTICPNGLNCDDNPNNTCQV